MAVQPGRPGSDAQAAHVRAVHARNNAHSDTAHVAAVHARNAADYRLGTANMIKTQLTDPTVPRDYNEPTRPYSKPKTPGKNT